MHEPAADRLAADTYRRSRGAWRLFALFAVALAILVGVGRFAWPESAGAPYIARLVIEGTIATDRERLAAIEALAKDESVQAVIVAINSPGGTTAGGEELYEALTRLRAARPTVAVIGELGASAAYMTAIATDRVLARRLSIVGSIGVLYQHVNAGKLLDTIGVGLDKVASGPLKAEPDINEPLEGPARDSIAALVDDSFQWFVDIVAERRDLERASALRLADGRIVTGRVGVETGLIDAIGGEREALDWLAQAREIDPELPIRTVWPLPAGGIDFIGTFLGEQARVALGMPQRTIPLDGLVSLWQVDARF